jgi:hypothetical protein
MAIMLGIAGSKLGIIYGMSALVSFAYHNSKEEHFVITDHVLAWTSIAANFWLAFHTQNWKYTLAGAVLVLKAIDSYSKARHDNRRNYDYNHTFWHIWCGMAGVFLVLGYKYELFRRIYENYSKGMLH